jgi:hypothetical protein
MPQVGTRRRLAKIIQSQINRNPDTIFLDLVISGRYKSGIGRNHVMTQFKTVADRRKLIAEDIAILTHPAVDLPQIASFLDDVYCLGVFEEPKAHTKAAKKHLAALDRTILKLVQDGVLIRSDQSHLSKMIFIVGRIRHDIDSHEYRTRRIMEDMTARAERW